MIKKREYLHIRPAIVVDQIRFGYLFKKSGTFESTVRHSTDHTIVGT